MIVAHALNASVKRALLALLLAAALPCLDAQAGEVALTEGCVSFVANLYKVPPSALAGLRASEGGAVGRVSRNTDGSVDIGPFQVNSRWVEYFRALWRRGSTEATAALLRDNGCANALAAAAIFRMALDQAHGDVGEAVGYYNSPHNSALAARYRRHFIDAYRAALRRGRLDQP